MSWEYRVVKLPDEDGRPKFIVAAIFYQKDGSIRQAIKYDELTANMVHKLVAHLERMLKGCSKPVLELRDGKLVEVEE